jgi:integrase/recombinase XerD
LSEVRRFPSKRTIAASEHILNLFVATCSKTVIREIERGDLLDHMSVLQEKGLSPRTVFIHTERIGTLLKANKISGLLTAADKPKYDEKAPDAYDADQLQALFNAALPEERMLFEFFLDTGFREQEVMFCT